MTTSTPALDSPSSISAAELHEILLTTHASGNLARRRFIDALRALHESRLYLERYFSSRSATLYSRRVAGGCGQL